VREAVARHAPGLAAMLQAGIQGSGGATLRRLISLQPNTDALLADLEAALREKEAKTTQPSA
jgi:hypothetical protein